MKRPIKVLSLLAILGACVIGPLIVRRLALKIGDDTRAQRVDQDLLDLQKVVEEYREATGSHPSTEQGLKVMVDRPNPPPPGWKRTLEAVPIDAWGNLYRYRFLSQDAQPAFEIISTGKDGVLGTEDDLSSLHP